MESYKLSQKKKYYGTTDLTGFRANNWDIGVGVLILLAIYFLGISVGEGMVAGLGLFGFETVFCRWGINEGLLLLRVILSLRSLFKDAGL